MDGHLGRIPGGLTATDSYPDVSVKSCRRSVITFNVAIQSRA